MQRVLACALAGLLLLGACPANAYERSELEPSHPLSPGGDLLQIAAFERGPADVAVDQPIAPSAMAKELVAVVPPSPPPPPAVTLLLRADLTTQKLTVTEGDQVLNVWPISSGRRGYATPTGTFRPAWMVRM